MCSSILMLAIGCYFMSSGVPIFVSNTSNRINSEPIGDSISLIHIFSYLPNLASNIDCFSLVTEREGSPIQSVWYIRCIYGFRLAISHIFVFTSSIVAFGSKMHSISGGQLYDWNLDCIFATTQMSPLTGTSPLYILSFTIYSLIWSSSNVFSYWSL